MKKTNDNLFFIIGVGRSGTSLLQEVMNTFEDFCNIGESRIYSERTFSLWTPVRKSNDFKMLEDFIKKNWTKKFFVEKTPDSIYCLPNMLKHFSESNYIFLERNPHDIVLSQLNLFENALDIRERFYHIDNLMMSDEDLLLNREQYFAKFTLKQIMFQVKHVEKFNKKIIIRYENFINEPEAHIDLLSKKFSIKSNMAQSLKKLSRTSYSGTPKVKKYKKIKDVTALDMIKLSQKLWNY